MRSLLDTSVLLALLDPNHAHHPRTREWWDHHFRDGWASCPITQNGYVRIASQPRYPNQLRIGDAVEMLRRQISIPGHEYWPDSLSISDVTIFDHAQIQGPQQITDIYLLGLAMRNEGRLVTLDRGIPLLAVRGATTANLVVIE